MTSIEATNDLETLLTWRGRSEATTEAVSAQWCQKLQNTLNRDADLAAGDRLPPLWHFITHLPSAPLNGLSRDGHPLRGGFLPPVALPRRMWAGGRFIFHAPIMIGQSVTRTSTIDDIVMKDGRSGLLCFVTVRHELSVDGDIKVTEEQDLVYRDDPAPDAPGPEPKPAPTNAAWSRTITPSEVMLFRYSALTFNAHRIHYDRDYAQNVEGYEGLVFHGPLTATLLADLAEAESGRPLTTFSFRAMSPLFDTAPFSIHGQPGDGDGDAAQMWAATPAGGLAMKASVTFGPE